MAHRRLPVRLRMRLQPAIVRTAMAWDREEGHRVRITVGVNRPDDVRCDLEAGFAWFASA